MHGHFLIITCNILKYTIPVTYTLHGKLIFNKILFKALGKYSKHRNNQL